MYFNSIGTDLWTAMPVVEGYRNKSRLWGRGGVHFYAFKITTLKREKLSIRRWKNWQFISCHFVTTSLNRTNYYWQNSNVNRIPNNILSYCNGFLQSCWPSPFRCWTCSYRCSAPCVCPCWASGSRRSSRSASCGPNATSAASITYSSRTSYWSSSASWLWCWARTSACRTSPGSCRVRIRHILILLF